MLGTDSPVRQALRAVIPARWRAEGRELVSEGRYHFFRTFFYRYRPSQRALLRWLASEARFYLWYYTGGRGQRLERPIFMIGAPRSGTTISVELFGLHPDVANLSEAMDVWDPKHYRDPEADHYWTAADVRPADADRIHGRFEYFRRRQQKPRFINKHPRNSVRIDYIRAMFPDAVFVHVLRDGRAVAASMVEFIEKRALRRRMKMPFAHPPNWRALVREDLLEQAALQWQAIMSCALSQRPALGSAYHAFKYEDLCADPRRVLGAAFRFAGLRDDAGVLERLPARLESQNFKWKTQWRPEQAALVNRIQGPLLAELGYDL